MSLNVVAEVLNKDCIFANAKKISIDPVTSVHHVLPWLTYIHSPIKENVTKSLERETKNPSFGLIITVALLSFISFNVLIFSPIFM